jgi:hypothetical protein
MEYIKFLNKVLAIIFLSLFLGYKMESDKLFKSYKKKLTAKTDITYFNNCKLLKSDLPDKNFYTYADIKNLKLENGNFCELIFGYRDKSKPSNLYLGMDNLKDTFFIAEKNGSSFNKNVLFTKNDNISRDLSVQKFSNYIAKQTERIITKSDTIYKIEFTEKPTVQLSSHMKYYPVKELYISFTTGIQKVIVENKCYKIVYD